MDCRSLIVGIVIGILFGGAACGIVLGARLQRTEAHYRQQLAIIREDAAHARQSLKTSDLGWCDAELESIEQVTIEKIGGAGWK